MLLPGVNIGDQGAQILSRFFKLKVKALLAFHDGDLSHGHVSLYSPLLALCGCSASSALVLMHCYCIGPCSLRFHPPPRSSLWRTAQLGRARRTRRRGRPADACLPGYIAQGPFCLHELGASVSRTGGQSQSSVGWLGYELGADFSVAAAAMKSPWCALAGTPWHQVRDCA